MIKKNSNKFFLFFILFFAILKQILVTKIPIFVLGTAIHDDRLMVNMGVSLLEGEWLGNYGELTLVKGIVYPLFLSACNLLGISYLSALSLNYTFSVLVLIFVLNKAIKSKYSLGVIYLTLLFNPISMSLLTFQRIYRNSLSASQVIMIIACFFAVYLNRNNETKPRIFWSTMAGLALSSLWHTREDSIWIIPFVLAVLIITLIFQYKETLKKAKYKVLISRIMVTLLPLIILFGSIGVISSINKKHYGTFVVNELNEGNFPKMIKAMYSIKPNDYIEHVSVPRETVDRIYEVSPTLLSIKEILESELDKWEVYGKVKGDCEVEDGWFFWCMRDAVSQSGYYETPEKADKFYNSVAEEIGVAFDQGFFEKRKPMPSALMPPWREEYGSQLVKGFIKAVGFVSKYDTMGAEMAKSAEDESGTDVQLFEDLTNNHAIEAYDHIKIKGWIFSKENADEIVASLVDQDGNYLQKILFDDGTDVYNYYYGIEGKDYINAHNSRFNIDCKYRKEINTDLFIKVENTDGNSMSIPLKGGEVIERIDDVEYHIDEIKDPSNNIFNKLISKKVQLINYIVKLYKTFSPIITLISIISYIYITIYVIFGLIKHRIVFLDEWLLLTGILGSFILLLVGIVYIDISAYSAINYMYLAGAYPLLNIFSMVSLIIAYNAIKEKIWKRIKRKSHDI